eukprot:6196284-Pleurochrysis_carterae.AAC.1
MVCSARVRLQTAGHLDIYLTRIEAIHEGDHLLVLGLHRLLFEKLHLAVEFRDPGSMHDAQLVQLVLGLFHGCLVLLLHRFVDLSLALVFHRRQRVLELRVDALELLGVLRLSPPLPPAPSLLRPLTQCRSCCPTSSTWRP